jgi:[ribosomal protein S5]-alanine N-acetyltransferase
MTLNLHTERLLLRPLTEDDVDLCLAIRTDPETTKYAGGPMAPEKVRENMSVQTRRSGGGCIGMWLVAERQTNEKIGIALLLPMPVEEDSINWDLVRGDDIPDAEIQLGYMLKPSAWGKGYATEVASRLLKFAFEDSTLDHIVACLDEENTASRRVLEKIGFEFAGKGRAYGKSLPQFRVSKQQWLDHNAPK